MTAFADTSAIYAVLDTRDDGHPRARRGQVVVQAERLVTHGFVVAETLALVRRRLGADATARFMDEYLPTLDVMHVDAATFDASIQVFRTSVGTSVSFVDRMSFAFMRLHGLTRAWALDADFQAAGFELVA